MKKDRLGILKKREVDFLKDAIKMFVLIAYGLVVVLFVYPATHELGHMIAATACGGEMKEWALFPLPCILCDISKISDTGMILIGMAGIFIPFFISEAIRFKNFAFWYGSLIFRVTVLLSMFISCAVILMSLFGITYENDDMIKVLMYWDKGEPWLMSLVLLALAVTVFHIVKEHPIKRIFQYFGI